MPADALGFVALAFALGFKHSFDADHVVAVSNVMARGPPLKRAATLSLAWSAGHMVTAALITAALFAGRAALGPVAEGGALDRMVAVMLVAIGALSLAWEFGYLHAHPHDHVGGAPHGHSHGTAPAGEHGHLHVHLRPRRDHAAMLGIGVVHGLASNDELLALLLGSLGITSLAGALAGVGVFSAGVVVGMVVFAAAVAVPARRWGSARVRRAVVVAAAAASLAYAAVLFAASG